MIPAGARSQETGSKRDKRGFKTKKDAEKFFNDQLNAIAKRTYIEPKDITLSENLDYCSKIAKPNTTEELLRYIAIDNTAF